MDWQQVKVGANNTTYKADFLYPQDLDEVVAQYGKEVVYDALLNVVLHHAKQKLSALVRYTPELTQSELDRYFSEYNPFDKRQGRTPSEEPSAALVARAKKLTPAARAKLIAVLGLND